MKYRRVALRADAGVNDVEGRFDGLAGLGGTAAAMLCFMGRYAAGQASQQRDQEEGRLQRLHDLSLQ